MKRRYTQFLLKRRLTGSAVLLDSDVRMSPGSRLALRLTVVKNRAALREVGLQLRKPVLPRSVVAFVNPLRVDVERSGRIVCHEFDRHYFAVMVLTREALTTETIAHESGHAAIFYSRRVKGNKWHGRVDDANDPQDAICYPLGHIAQAVTDELRRAGLWAAHA